MKRLMAILSFAVFFVIATGASPVFFAETETGVSGARITYDSGKFTQTSDSVKSLSFTIDSAEPEIMVMEQKRNGIAFRSERLNIVNVTENLIQAAIVNGESIQIYTILRKAKVVFYSNQRAEFVSSTAVFPALVASMSGAVDILIDKY